MTQVDPRAAMHLSDAAVSVEIETPDMTLNIGPQHPSTHGVLRLVAQVATAVAASLIVLEGESSVWLIGVAAVWIVTFINEYNFMDGVDGLAGALLGIVGLTWIIAGGIEDLIARRAR